ncbi:MAG: hypothetical protein QOG30_208 [Acidimicrobiaceae bacterium]
MAIAEETLPRWDLTPFYPSLDSREFSNAHEGVGAGVARLTALYDEHDVRGGDPVELDDEALAAFEAVIAETNDLQDHLRLVNAYLYGFVTTDARDDRAAALQSQLQAQAAPLRTLSSRFSEWVARLGAERLIESSQVAADHAWPLRKAEFAATHQMTEDEEGLAAELNLTGGAAWNRLHGDVTARLTANVNGEDLAMTIVRNLALDADPLVRRAAYDAELAAWESASVPLAAAMNGIKGEANVLNRRRGWEDSLAPALFYNAVDRPTLEAKKRRALPRSPTFAATSEPRRGSSATATPACRGGTCSRRSVTRAPMSAPGTRPSITCAPPSRRTPPRCCRSPSAPSRSDGSMPRRTTANAAERSACRCGGTRAECC